MTVSVVGLVAAELVLAAVHMELVTGTGQTAVLTAVERLAGGMGPMARGGNDGIRAKLGG